MLMLIILPVSIYKLIYGDPDYKKLAPGSKVTMRTYTTDKINIAGSCSLFAVHPDTCNLKQVTCHVTSHEDSLVLSCVTTLELGLIQHCNNLENSIPPTASLISSKAHYPKKRS